MHDERTFVAVLYNFLGEDEYEKLKHVDPASLPFEAHYDVQVATVREEYHAVVKALRREGYRARAFNIKDDLRTLESLLRRTRRPDVVFNLIESFHDDPTLEGHITALFELHRVAYTGAPPFALALCQQKDVTKRLLRAHGVPTPRFRILQEPKITRRHGLEYPLIVKPAGEDASAGVTRFSVVHDYDQLRLQLAVVHEEFGVPILLEEFIAGTELHVSVLGNDPPHVLPMIAWDFSEVPEEYPPIISFAAKWDPLHEVYHRVHSVCPAELPTRVRHRVERVALAAYRLTGCRDYARLDVRLRGNRPYVLEVNPNPDLTEGVSFMESAEIAGYSFGATLRAIVQLALERRPEPLAPPPVAPDAGPSPSGG